MGAMTRVHLSPTETADERECYRLRVLGSLNLLDSPPEAEFDSIVRIARHILGCPIALISLVDDHRQWFKARCGLDASETSRDIAFCVHAIQADDIMVVADAARDPRFADNPLVTGPPHIRFYAGVPIRLSLDDGGPPAALGTLCVIDTRPRMLADDQAEMLRHLARLTEELIRRRILVGNAVRYAEERRAAALRITRQHRQLTQAERIAQFGSWRLALEDDHLEWSDQVFAIHDLPHDRIPALDAALDFYPPHSRAIIVAALSATVEAGTPFDVEADFVSATGRQKRIRCMGELEMLDGAPVALIGVFQDITVRFHLEQALRRSASQDALTGIANRAGFTVALDAAIERARVGERPLALVLIDLDGFKQVNDTHGHLAGDMILQEVARRLQAPGLAECLPARLGGDEFVVIVTSLRDCARLDAIVAELLETLRQPIATSGGAVTISGTIGVGWLTDDVARRELLHRADLALYEAKRAGKGIARTWTAAAVTGEPAGPRATARHG